jgi:hypothetical protein
MKHIKLFEQLDFYDGYFRRTGIDSPDDWKMHLNQIESLFFNKRGKKYEIKVDGSNSWIKLYDAEEDLEELPDGWRLPTLEELEHINKKLRAGRLNIKDPYHPFRIPDGAYFYGERLKYYWSSEKAFDEPEREEMYVWDFDKQTDRILDPTHSTANLLYIRELK